MNTDKGLFREMYIIVMSSIAYMSAHLLTCSLLQVSLLVKEGLAASPSCTVVFLLLYFSLLSSAA